jgi:hypothetical protein
MSTLKKILAGTAGVAALVGLASPAAAQYYPGYNNGYGNNVGNAVGQAINGVIAATQYGNYPYGNAGYGQRYAYGMNSNSAVDQCGRALQARYGGYGYNAGPRISGIRSVEPRNRGAVRVDGMVSTYSGYGYGAPNQTFSCKVDRYGRVIDLRIDRNDRYGYNGYNQRGW